MSSNDVALPQFNAISIKPILFSYQNGCSLGPSENTGALGQSERTQTKFIAKPHRSGTQAGHGITIMIDINYLSQITCIEFNPQPHCVG